MDHYREHSLFSDPGAHEQALSQLPEDAPSLFHFATQLVTLPEEMRRPNHIYKTQQLRHYRHFVHVKDVLDSLLASSHDLHPLAQEERLALPAEQQALLLCGLLRQRKIRARMRAGFSFQADAELWSGHWICEWQGREAEPWHRCDVPSAQTELDERVFISGSEAWSKRKELDCNQFRHDRLKGLSAIKRFLLNDFHCLAEQEMVHHKWLHSGGGKGPPLFYRSASSLTRAQWQQLDTIAEICLQADSRPSLLSCEFEQYVADAEVVTASQH